jgi:plasmid stabilization system protein ParE
MRLEWTETALDDLVRIHDFLAPEAPDAAARMMQALMNAAENLLQIPRIGERLDAYAPREVRALMLVDARYEMRYEVLPTRVVIVRIWSTREHR